MTGLPIDDLQKLMHTREDLDPELEPWVDDGPLGGKALRHPLVYNIFLAPEMYALCNEQLKHKKAALARALKEKDWHTFVYLHERPWRIDAFTQICWRMGDSRYWKLLGNIYTDTENLWQNFDTWVDCLTAERRYRSHMMTDDERAALKNDFGSELTVYRGFHGDGTANGVSWTANRIVAKFFARRLAQPGDQRFLATGLVKRRDVIAFFDGRSEYEMVILPADVHGVQITELEGDD